LLQFRENRPAIDPRPSVKLIDADLNFPAHFIELRLAEAILVTEEPQPLADDFAGGLVTSALDLALHELFEFWRE
jgi:hypothetical protein